MEGLVEGHGLEDAAGVAELADRVHRQLGTADVDGDQAELRGQDRPDGRSTRRIITDDHLLQRDRRLPGDLLQHGVGRRRRRVLLIVVDLDDNAAVEGGTVVLFVFGRIVRVPGVGLVGRDQHTAGYGHLKGALLTAARETTKHVLSPAAVGSLGRGRSNLKEKTLQTTQKSPKFHEFSPFYCSLSNCGSFSICRGFWL